MPFGEHSKRERWDRFRKRRRTLTKWTECGHISQREHDLIFEHMRQLYKADLPMPRTEKMLEDLRDLGDIHVGLPAVYHPAGGYRK